MKIDSWIEGLNIPGKPDEWEVKELFKIYNINTPNGVIVRPDDDFRGTQLEKPYVVKVCDSKILHKTDIGGVKLNVTDNLDVVISEMQDLFPESNLLLEEMVPYSSVC